MKITLIYFSPTKTTKKTLEAIASGITEEKPEKIDLTKSKNRGKEINIDSDLVIVGGPCYEATIPPVMRETMKFLNGNNIPTIAVILYGNRTLGTALKDLVGFLDENNFKVIGTGTFLGEHSFTHSELKIAEGRPDNKDIEEAKKFGALIKEKGLDLRKLTKDDISGRTAWWFKLIPEGFFGSFGYPSKLDESKCTKCNVCIKSCPTDAIDPNTYEINMKNCIRCMACVKLCSEGARKVKLNYGFIVKKFMKPAISSYRKPRYKLSNQI